MSGRQKAAGWGGKREGAGAKPQTLTEKQVQNLLKAAEKWEKLKGKSVDDILMSFVYGEEENGEPVDISGAVRMKALQVYKENTQGKLSEGGDTDKNLGPGLFLPEQQKDPALKVVGE